MRQRLMRSTGQSSAEVNVDDALLARFPLPDHGDTTSKGDRGTVLVVGASVQTLGASLLAGIAALRSGAGKLQLVTDRAAVIPLGIAVPEALVAPIEDCDALARSADAVLVGPGVLDAETGDATMEHIAKCVVAGTTLVVDAGALAGARHVRDRPRTIAIPNVKEAAQILDAEPQVVSGRPREALDALVDQLGTCVALRDAVTWIGTPEGERFVDRSGHAALATSGSGDVAAGIVAGLAARGALPLAATLWAVRTHGHIGECLAARHRGVGALARDLLDEIPAALNAPTPQPHT
jgi:ADP-dependent NAD(P)H-hydrate dehydratase